MRERIEVVYENGVFRPVHAPSAALKEHQHLTVTIEAETAAWGEGADSSVSLDTVRQALGKVPGTLAQMIHAEREER